MYLLKIISERARDSFPGEFTVERINEWYAHWFNTAAQLRKEFVKEGLTQSIEHLDKIVKDQERLSNRY